MERAECLAEQYDSPTQGELGPLHPESSAVTIRPLCLSQVEKKMTSTKVVVVCLPVVNAIVMGLGVSTFVLTKTFLIGPWGENEEWTEKFRRVITERLGIATGG